MSQAHDADRQAQETARIYREARAATNREAREQADRDRATMHARREQAR